MPDYHIPLHPGGQYHIFSRAVGDEKMFRERFNYAFFRERFEKYILPVANIYCFCLLPNHFHFLIRIKDQRYIQEHFAEVKKKVYNPELAPDFIMERFSNLLNSYAKSYNELYHRKGGLFIDYLRRVEILSENQFAATVFYIHKNPVHHGYCESMSKWPWTSFRMLISNRPTILLRKETLGYFGGSKGFITYHNQPIVLKEHEMPE